MGRALLVWLLLLGGAAVLLTAPGSATAQDEPAPRINPHGAADACESCHAPAASGADLQSMQWADEGPNETCFSCHPEAPHQVGIDAHRRGDDDPNIDRNKARVPPELPLLNGQLACLTCHNETACDGRPPDPDNPRFFRGGPYEPLGELCSLCHGAADTVRFNPHEAMDENRDTTAICEFCHDLGEDGTPDLDALLVSHVKICWGCHKDTRHTGSEEHLKKLDEGMRTRADAAELPLTPEGEVFCGTCHDPHPPGSKKSAMGRVETAGKPLFTDPWLWSTLEPILAERAESLGTNLDKWVVEPPHLRKQLRSNELCGTCHTPDDTERRRREARK